MALSDSIKTEAAPTHDDVYTFGHTRRGVAIIIINDKSGHDNEPRNGCGIDRDMLQDMFSRLGFEIRTFWDRGAEDILKELQRISKEDHSDTDCLAVAISTHGSEIETHGKVREDVIETRDGDIKTKLLLEMFCDSRCPSLKGKPRLFFIQACRGYNLDSGQEVHYTKTSLHSSTPGQSATGQMDDIYNARPTVHFQDSKMESLNSARHEEKPLPLPNLQRGARAQDMPQLPLSEVLVKPAPCYKDFLVMYATPPGYYAFRNPRRGSWFIRCLNSVILSNDGPENLTQQLTRVVAKVCQETSRNSTVASLHNKKQSPVIYSMLTRDIHLRARPLETSV